MKLPIWLTALALACAPGEGDDTSDDTSDDTGSDSGDTAVAGDAYAGPCDPAGIDYRVVVSAEASDWLVDADLHQFGGPEASTTLHHGTIAVERDLPLGPDQRLGVVVEFVDALVLGTPTSTFGTFGVAAGLATDSLPFGHSSYSGALVSDGTMTFGQPQGFAVWQSGEVQLKAFGLITGAAAGQRLECIGLAVDVPATAYDAQGANPHAIASTDPFPFEGVSWLYSDNADTTGSTAPITFDTN